MTYQCEKCGYEFNALTGADLLRQALEHRKTCRWFSDDREDEIRAEVEKRLAEAKSTDD